MRFMTDEDIQAIFAPTIRATTDAAIQDAMKACRQLSVWSNPQRLLDIDDDESYAANFLERLALEPNQRTPVKKQGLANGIRRILIAQMSNDPIDTRLIQTLHNEVSELDDPKRRGNWRSKNPKQRFEGQAYASYENIDRLVGLACILLQTTHTPPLVRAASFQTALEAIHPFADANGRVARLCLALVLARGECPPVAFDTKWLMHVYHESTIKWIREREANPMLTLISQEVESEAKNRLFFALT